MPDIILKLTESLITELPNYNIFAYSISQDKIDLTKPFILLVSGGEDDIPKQDWESNVAQVSKVNVDIWSPTITKTQETFDAFKIALQAITIDGIDLQQKRPITEFMSESTSLQDKAGNVTSGIVYSFTITVGWHHDQTI